MAAASTCMIERIQLVKLQERVIELTRKLDRLFEEQMEPIIAKLVDGQLPEEEKKDVEAVSAEAGAADFHGVPRGDCRSGKKRSDSAGGCVVQLPRVRRDNRSHQLSERRPVE